MGLDIYFYRRKVGEETKPSEQIAYFRKDNFLVKYFDYEINCSYKFISKAEVVKLIDICQIVLDDHSLAPILLPTKKGFFFGSTSYNRGYFQDVQGVRDIFTAILASLDFNQNELIMYCSW